MAPREAREPEVRHSRVAGQIVEAGLVVGYAVVAPEHQLLRGLADESYPVTSKLRTQAARVEDLAHDDAGEFHARLRVAARGHRAGEGAVVDRREHYHHQHGKALRISVS